MKSQIFGYDHSLHQSHAKIENSPAALGGNGIISRAFHGGHTGESDRFPPHNNLGKHKSWARSNRPNFLQNNQINSAENIAEFPLEANQKSIEWKR